MPLACSVLSTVPGRMSGRITHLLSLYRGAPLSASHHKNTNIPFSGKQTEEKNATTRLKESQLAFQRLPRGL